MRRENLDWAAMSLQMGTRSATQMSDRWYKILAPSMREAGEWGRGEDRILLAALLEEGAAEETEVEWAGLVPGRAGRVCIKRWRLMTKRVPDALEEGFEGCLDYLVRQFAPDLAPAAAEEEEEDMEEDVDEGEGEDEAEDD